MIEVVDGEGVGAGKSYYVAGRVLAHLARGLHVCACETFKLKWEGAVKYCQEVYDVQIKPEQWHTFPEGDIQRVNEVTLAGSPDAPVLVVIDEAQGQLNVKDVSTRSQPKDLMFLWLTQSRHDDTDVIFITQDDGNIDVRIRRLATFVVSMVNLRQMSVPGLGPYPQWSWLPMFRANIFRKDGKTLIERKFLRAEPLRFGAYESKSMRLLHRRASQTPATKLQLERVKKGKSMKRPLVWFTLFCLCVGIYGVWHVYQKHVVMPRKEVAAAAAKKSEPAKVDPTKAAVNGAVSVGQAIATSTSTFGGKPKGEWESVSEVFRGGDGQTYLRTDVATYEVGEMSPHGFVKGIRGRVAKCETEFRSVLYVVGGDDLEARRRAATLPAQELKVPEKKNEIIIAEWKPLPTPDIDRDEAAIDAERKRKIGGGR